MKAAGEGDGDVAGLVEEKRDLELLAHHHRNFETVELDVVAHLAEFVGLARSGNRDVRDGVDRASAVTSGHEVKPGRSVRHGRGRPDEAIGGARVLELEKELHLVQADRAFRPRVDDLEFTQGVDRGGGQLLGACDAGRNQ